MKKVNFLINVKEWQLFKKSCKDRGTNASVELRRFIKRYVKKGAEQKGKGKE